MKNKLPSEYQPYDRLTICSNALIGVGAIIKIGDIEPILIGKGLRKPLIWLKARTNNQAWIQVVEQSVSLFPQIVSMIEDTPNTIIIKANSNVIINAIQDGSTCIVKELDLRPLGLNIFGDSQSLKVGGNEFTGNTMQGVGTFIGIDDK
ncbi:hypothetical protein SDC9_23499 [bioreactor metagenome]|uniref:Uncharacterized protein n=1 Tax=bioreactor metagenome TaxID=1076179 RepID=A0A644UFN2_9ZZZZ